MTGFRLSLPGTHCRESAAHPEGLMPQLQSLPLAAVVPALDRHWHIQEEAVFSL